MPHSTPRIDHLPPSGAAGPELIERADLVLAWRGSQHLAHSQILALASQHLGTLVALAERDAGVNLPVVSVLPSASLVSEVPAAAEQPKQLDEPAAM